MRLYGVRFADQACQEARSPTRRAVNCYMNRAFGKAWVRRVRTAAGLRQGRSRLRQGLRQGGGDGSSKAGIVNWAIAA